MVGDFVMTDLRTMEYVIPDLDKVGAGIIFYIVFIFPAESLM